MLSMSDVINSLKYEHEYNQFSKRFAGLHDVKKNSFFLWRQSSDILHDIQQMNVRLSTCSAEQ